ncbi:hypothetical protein [Rheinheimera sp. 4Y26]|uniref:hypothetical protein n=1 Tax=Rheinheimera sp. 4Y26 TaxID=2977811 RepID=UPI0021B0EF49|nr:hypothetical protein [Rheinheimera sp. 4Y26]MCT6700507.1 hypothetical protein [Rheinheimera sp. 4Y26]
MDQNCEIGKKVVLKSNNIINFLKIILLIAAVFFISKMRFELGGGLMVDLIFIPVCIFLAFLFNVSSEAKIIFNGEHLKVKLMKNIIGIKIVSVSNKNGNLFRKITTLSTIKIKNIFENRTLVISDMNQSKVEVSIINT